MLVQGLKPTEIAKNLHITPLTATQHLKMIYAEQGVTGPGAQERLAKKIGRAIPIAWITKREQVRAYLAARLSAEAIAGMMRITKKAVRHHISLLRETGLDTTHSNGGGGEYGMSSNHMKGSITRAMRESWSA